MSNRRPRIGSRIVDGLVIIHERAMHDLVDVGAGASLDDSDTLSDEDKYREKAVHAALDYIDKLIEWFGEK